MSTTMKNKYLKRGHISERKFREILKYFCGVLATQSSRLANISRNSINKIYKKLRFHILDLLNDDDQKFCEG